MTCENGVNTGPECRDVEIWRVGDAYTHYTKMGISINVSRYRTDMM